MSELMEAIKMISRNTVEQEKPVAVLFGEVLTKTPLSIKIDENITLSETQLILTNAVRDYKSFLTFDNPAVKQLVTNWDVEETTESDPYRLAFKARQKHTITIYNALETGEIVILLRIKGGQRYVVLDRVEVRD